MKQSIATERTHITGKQTAEGVRTTSPKSGCHSLYVGMDVHKDTIAVAIAALGWLDPEYRGEIPNNSGSPRPSHLKRKAANASHEAKEIAWTTQKRLCGRYRRLTQTGKNTRLVCVAIARKFHKRWQVPPNPLV